MQTKGSQNWIKKATFAIMEPGNAEIYTSVYSFVYSFGDLKRGHSYLDNMRTTCVQHVYNMRTYDAAIEKYGSRDGAVVRTLAAYQCGPGSIPRPGFICGSSL